MALWTASALNKTDIAMMFPQVITSQALELPRKKNGLLYAVLGKREKADDPKTMNKFERSEMIAGYSIEATLMGPLRAIATVADGSAENATATPYFADNDFGGAKWDLTHFVDQQSLVNSQFDRIVGKEKKIVISFVSQVARKVLLDYEQTMGQMLNGYVNSTTWTPADQSRTVLGSWTYAVANDNTYGTIDRTDIANIDYRSYVPDPVGDLKLSNLRDAKNNVSLSGGNANFGQCAVAQYTKIQQLIENQSYIVNQQDWQEYGGELVAYYHTNFCLDKWAPNGQIGLLDPESWRWFGQSKGFDSSFREAWWLVASNILWSQGWNGLICIQPNWNAKLTGITS